MDELVSRYFCNIFKRSFPIGGAKIFFGRTSAPRASPPYSRSAFQLTRLGKVNVDTQAGTFKDGTGTPQAAATFAGMVIDY